ncbi:replicative DNA helicase [Streptomyces sp. NPDC059524]|uniref:replicative DNA helicase n=1 Tax=Streptomyces sp. NPDC059524 TaxID=3346856 RepID=UPI0036BC3933
MSIPQQVLEDAPAPAYGPESDFDGRSFDRMPPQDLDAEQCVLGGMEASLTAIEDVVGDIRLQIRDFYKPAHQTIYRAICDMYAAGEPVDPITLSAKLTERGKLAKVGGASYLHHLVQVVPSAANAQWYAEIVQRKAVRRRMVEAGTRITQLGYADGDLDDDLNQAGAEIVQLSDAHAEDDYAPIGDDIDADIDAIEAMSRRDGALIGLPTGFMDLDGLLGGFQSDQFVIVAGRPAMGKTTLAMDFARACAFDNDIPVGFFSLEMGRREINYRLLSATGKVPLHHIRTGQMTEDDWSRVATAMPKVKAAPLYVDASPNQTMMDIRSKARRMVQRHGVRMIVIDYIQLMQTGSSRPGESRQQDVSDISRNLKLMAKELQLPVIGLSQLNRGPEQRADKTPAVSDLRESGSLEQDADIVILLHREDAYEKESPRAGEADIIVGKHRNGPTATVTVAFQGHYSRFVDMAQT